MASYLYEAFDSVLSGPTATGSIKRKDEGTGKVRTIKFDSVPAGDELSDFAKHANLYGAKFTKTADTDGTKATKTETAKGDAAEAAVLSMGNVGNLASRAILDKLKAAREAAIAAKQKA